MKDPFIAKVQLLVSLLTTLMVVVILSIVFIFYVQADPTLSAILPEKEEEPEPLSTAVVTDDVVDGIHVATGFVVDDGYKTVIATCTACHSAKLVTQNRANEEGWTKMIRWMQETQNLWELGDSEEIIVKYLAKNYAPKKSGRRSNLANIEWYELED